MVRNIVNKLNVWMVRLETAFDNLFGARFPPGALFAVDCKNRYLPQSTAQSFNLKDILNEGFVWTAVPKHRRSLEKRMSRKYGFKEYVWKPHVLRTNLLMCPTCGHDYEAGRLCHHCYHRVRNETQEMQHAVVRNLGLDPVEKDVVVLYEGEKITKTTEFWQGQRIVEVPKKRPAWFSSNLLQPTTQESSDSTDVKPNELA